MTKVHLEKKHHQHNEVVVLIGVHFIQESQNSGSEHVQVLLVVHQMFMMVTLSGDGPGWKYGSSYFDGPTTLYSSFQTS